MKLLSLTGLFMLTSLFVFSQNTDVIINTKEVQRIENVLASDEMRGRKVFTPELDKATDFIEKEFKAAGLEPISKGGGYKQEFALVRTRQLTLSALVNGASADASKVMVISSKKHLKVDQSFGYETAAIITGDNIFQKALDITDTRKNTIVWVDESFANSFPRLSFFKRNLFQSAPDIVFILGKPAASFSIETTQEVTAQKLANIVGALPGKSKKDEYVIFSGHYDHIGIGKPVGNDSINNGANDDAAGITAVIMLAKYFKALKNNERTILFAAFTAEEVGGYGSKYFSKQLDPEKVIAMFNIEMIGTESKWGINSAYITGYEKTDMGAILQKSLQGSEFTFYPDPYTEQNLFYRSDNATLAELGVPAHTISTSKMDSEPNYHKVSDEVSTLDMDNMARIIKAIALSSESIISGKATPTRVKPEQH